MSHNFVSLQVLLVATLPHSAGGLDIIGRFYKGASILHAAFDCRAPTVENCLLLLESTAPMKYITALGAFYLPIEDLNISEVGFMGLHPIPFFAMIMVGRKMR